jgi:hypothetical protein
MDIVSGYVKYSYTVHLHFLVKIHVINNVKYKIVLKIACVNLNLYNLCLP